MTNLQNQVEFFELQGNDAELLCLLTSDPACALWRNSTARTRKSTHRPTRV